jgi:hypothetical protein
MGNFMNFVKNIEDTTEMQQFVEMCFNLHSSINERLRRTIVEILGE